MNNNTLDRAKDEAKRIANEMRAGAERVRQEVETKLPGIGNYTRLIHKTRLAHLIILAVQAVALYLHADVIGLTFFLPILLLILTNAYIVGRRWHYRVDGRHDVQQLTNQQQPAVKAQYALGLFGAFVLALLVHLLSPSLETSVTSFIYNLAKYASVLAGGVTVAVEVYEGLHMNQKHQ